MKAIALLSFVLVTGISAMAQDSIWITPARPHRGEKVTVYFHSSDPAFSHTKELPGAFYNLADPNIVMAQDLLFKRSGDNWAAVARVTDTAYAIAANVVRPETDAIATGTAVGLDSSNGQPFLRTYLTLAYAWSDGSKLIGIKADRNKGHLLRRQYWDNLSAPPPGFANEFLYYLMTKKDTAKVLDLFANLPLDTTAMESDYTKASDYAVLFKNQPLATLLIHVRNLRYPIGESRRFEFYNRMIDSKDTAQRRKILDEYRNNYPDDGQKAGGNPLLPTLTSILRLAVATEGDLQRALALIPQTTSSLDRAGEYNNIAWMAGEKNVHLPEALALAKAGLDTFEALKTSGMGKPAYQTLSQYRKTIIENIGLIADTYAYLLMKSGDYEKAYYYEKMSIASSGPKPDVSVVQRYHLAMEKVEKPAKVVASLSGYIAKGQSDSIMAAQFKRLYKGTKSVDVAYAELEARARSLKEAEMVKTFLNSPASKFTLVDLDGRNVSLDSLKGKTVVVDFWATWCGPCQASFPAMQKLVDRYKDDKTVALLFVDTWENGDDKKQNAVDFMKKSPYTFHVLLDNDSKVAADYKVGGIPTKFVIDPKGVTLFKAVGFNGDTDRTVAELDDMIQLARKQ